MADKPGRNLAQRIKATLDAKDEVARHREVEKKRRREDGQKARAALLSDLAEFARQVSHFRVQVGPKGLEITHEGRSLVFRPIGTLERVRVSGTDLKGEHRLFLEQNLKKWVWATRAKQGAEKRRVLYDGGLEVLVEKALGVKAAETAPSDGTSSKTSSGEAKKRSL